MQASKKCSTNVTNIHTKPVNVINIHIRIYLFKRFVLKETVFQDIDVPVYAY